jgi:DNA-binding GntR family transcriptional regulator
MSETTERPRGVLIDRIREEILHQRLVRDETVLNRSEADQEFHLVLAGLNFRRRYDGYWYWGARGTRSGEAAAEHQRLLAAIARGDRDDAIGELRSHLGRAWHNYERFLNTSAEINVPGQG